MVMWAMDISTDPDCSRNVNPDIVLGNGMGQDSRDLSHQAVLHCHIVSPVLPLFTVHKVIPLPFLSCLSATYLLMVMVMVHACPHLKAVHQLLDTGEQ